MARILLISEIFPPTNGGSGRWLSHVYLHTRSHETVCLVGAHDDCNAYDSTHPNRTIIRKNLHIADRAPGSLASVKRYWTLIKLAKRCAKEQRVTQVHAARPLSEGLVAKAVAWRLGLPYVCYVHGEDVSVASTSRELKYVTQRVLRSASRIIANSDFTKGLLTKQWSVPEEKLEVIHPGVDTDFFAPEPRCLETRDELGWGDRPVVLTVGRIQTRKGQDNFIRALPQIAKRVPQILYSVVGGGDSLMQLKELACELGVRKNVDFKGEVNDLTMRQCYQQCDLFCLPNRDVGADVEGFGMVSLEAQATGKASLVGNSGGAPETVVVGQTGYVIDATSPANIANKVSELLLDPQRLQQLGDRARERAVDQFDWSAIVSRSENTFSRIDAGTQA